MALAMMMGVFIIEHFEETKVYGNSSGTREVSSAACLVVNSG